MFRNWSKVVVGFVKELFDMFRGIFESIIEEEVQESNLENWMKDRVELWCRLFNEGSAVPEKNFTRYGCQKWEKMPEDLEDFSLVKMQV